MNKMRIVKRAVDAAMTVLLICLMLYQLTGQLFHEYAGAAMFVLFIIHHILNYRWLKNIAKGKYSAARIALTVIDILLIIDMLGLMISGIMLSRYVFSFLNIRVGISFARTAHMLCSYWGLALMSVHIGLHWKLIIRPLEKAPVHCVYILRAAAAAAAAFGLYAFIKNRIISCLFLVQQYAVADSEQTLLTSALEYAASMVLVIFVTYYASRLLWRENHVKR